MICTYCKSDKVRLVDGTYVCTECGTVLGYEMMPPIFKDVPLRKTSTLVILLNKEDKKTIKRKYSEIVEYYITKICEGLGMPELREDAVRLFKNLDRRIYQGKNPKVLAASIVYIAADRQQIYIHKSNIAEILKISKYSIRDTVLKLRKHVHT
ncbi:MAG: transcription initiation factor IIB family protein [Pyrobaculum sp.]